MAIIQGSVQFGVRIAIKTPILPDETMMKTIVAQAESKLTKMFSAVVGTALNFMPGVSAEISEAKTQLKIDTVKP